MTHTADQPHEADRVADLFLVFVPITVVLEMTHGDPMAIFFCSCVAIIPLARLMGKATEALAEHFGPEIGGLLNASFGNSAELIVAFVAIDGESNWMEGLLLLVVYVILGIAFYHLPAESSAAVGIP